jgi:HlyD family secretion protein
MSRSLRAVVMLVVVALVTAGGAYAWRVRLSAPTGDRPLVLYGNVEIRQVDLAFGVEGPLADVLVDEGDDVEAGQTLAVLDQDAFRYGEATAEALLKVAEAKLDERR